MSDNKFKEGYDFFPKSLNDAAQETINQLRSEARALREKNNQLITELWDIDRQLISVKDTSLAERLHQRKNEIEQQRLEEQYDTKLNELLEAIKQLEMDSQGHSQIGSSSPYVL